MKIEEQLNTVDKYTVTGIPTSLLPAMCKEANINYDRLMEELRGQTAGLVGGEGMIYPWDIKRFIKGLLNLD